MADAKNTVLFPYETLKKLSMDAFQKFGFSEKEADIIQDVLLTSDLFGIQSHGMQRMVRYHKGITNGLIKIDAKPEIVKETPISAVIDGHDGMGQLLGHKAMLRPHSWFHCTMYIYDIAFPFYVLYFYTA